MNLDAVVRDMRRTGWWIHRRSDRLHWIHEGAERALCGVHGKHLGACLNDATAADLREQGCEHCLHARDRDSVTLLIFGALGTCALDNMNPRDTR